MTREVSKSYIIKYIVILAIGVVLGQGYLMIYHRPWFCNIAMLGGVGSVPAFCLEDAIKKLKG